jgi:hypothetical protein
MVAEFKSVTDNVALSIKEMRHLYFYSFGPKEDCGVEPSRTVFLISCIVLCFYFTCWLLACRLSSVGLVEGCICRWKLLVVG